MNNKYNPNDITIIRESLGLSKAEFAQRLGTHRATVYGWESGKNKPSNLVQEKLAKAEYYSKNDKETPNQF